MFELLLSRLPNYAGQSVWIIDRDHGTPPHPDGMADHLLNVQTWEWERKNPGDPASPSFILDDMKAFDFRKEVQFLLQKANTIEDGEARRGIIKKAIQQVLKKFPDVTYP